MFQLSPFPLALSISLFVTIGCSGTENPDGGATTGGTTGGTGGLTLADIGGPVPGPVDNHCYDTTQPVDGGLTFMAQDVNQSSCSVAPTTPPTGNPYGPTNYNSGSNDDDCKYVVSWTSTPIAKGIPVTFWFATKYSTTGVPVIGMSGTPDGGPAVASCPPLAPQADQIYFEVAGDPDGGIANHVNAALAGVIPPITETPPGSGVYRIGPETFFDVSGLWYVRFHFNENCCDGANADSPHGHAAYYVNVP